MGRAEGKGWEGQRGGVREGEGRGGRSREKGWEGQRVRGGRGTG